MEIIPFNIFQYFIFDFLDCLDQMQMIKTNCYFNSLQITTLQGITNYRILKLPKEIADNLENTLYFSYFGSHFNLSNDVNTNRFRLKKTINNYMNVYSFALYPEQHKPSGTMNFSSPFSTDTLKFKSSFN